MHGLAGKTAVVTGGGRGIGRGIARRLAEAGALVVVHYGSDQESAEKTVREIENGGGRAVAVAARFGADDPDLAAQRLWAAVDGVAAGVDILVNNAGITGARTPIGAAMTEELRSQFEINALAPFFVTKHALPRLRDGGRIVTISTGLTRNAAEPDLIGYVMSKAAVEMLTPRLAKELGPRGITVNTVAPGVVDTDMNADWLPYAREQAAALSALGRVGEPADIADVVAFLAGEGGRWVTGQWIDASGGSLL